jgi:hypothetical protein
MLLFPMARAAREQLEAPDVVAHVRAPHQTHLGQIQQISIDGCAIETAPDQPIAELTVAESGPSLLQVLQHLDPGQGRAKAGAPEDIPERIGFGRLHFSEYLRASHLVRNAAPPWAHEQAANLGGDSDTDLRHNVPVARVCGLGSWAARRVGGVALQELDE